jgi:endonuclease III
MTADKLTGVNTNQLAAAIRRARLGCRNLSASKAAKNLKALAVLVLEKHRGDASAVWATPKNFKKLFENLYEIPGIGTGIGNMMAFFFVLFGMVPQIKKSAENLSKLLPKADTHVTHVFFRAGLAEKATEKAALDAARKWAPELPASLDSAGFHIGRMYCHKSDPNCDDCPIAFKTDGSHLCPRVGLE